MIIKDFERCYCDCHITNKVKHIIPCCIYCPKCGERIKQAYVESHYRQCDGDFIYQQKMCIQEDSND